MNLQEIRKSIIVESFIQNDLEKGAKANIGEIREWQGKKVQKQANGEWKEVVDKTQKSGKFIVGDTWEWHGKEWDKKGHKYVPTVKLVKITSIKSNGDILGQFEDSDEKYIIRDANKYLKKRTEGDGSEKLSPYQFSKKELSEMTGKDGWKQGMGSTIIKNYGGSDKMIQDISISPEYDDDDNVYIQVRISGHSIPKTEDSELFYKEINSLRDKKFSFAKEAVEAADKFANKMNKSSDSKQETSDKNKESISKEDLANKIKDIHKKITKAEALDILGINQEEIFKAKKANIGEIREWNGKKMQKQANGEWKEVSGGKEKKERVVPEIGKMYKVDWDGPSLVEVKKYAWDEVLLRRKQGNTNKDAIGTRNRIIVSVDEFNEMLVS